MKKILLSALFAILAGCAQMGVQAPDSVDERMAYGYAGIAAAQESAANALMSNQLSVRDAETVLTGCDQARALLDAARQSETVGDITTMNGKLVEATVLLTHMQQFLLSYGVK